jgi:hypothetical protein
MQAKKVGKLAAKGFTIRLNMTFFLSLAHTFEVPTRHLLKGEKLNKFLPTKFI